MNEAIGDKGVSVEAEEDGLLVNKLAKMEVLSVGTGLEEGAEKGRIRGDGLGSHEVENGEGFVHALVERKGRGRWERR